MKNIKFKNFWIKKVFIVSILSINNHLYGAITYSSFSDFSTGTYIGYGTQVLNSNGGEIQLGYRGVEISPGYRLLNDIPVSLQGTCSISWNGRLYVVGGDNGSAQSSVYSAQISVDGSVGAWNTETNSLPSARRYHSMAVWNGRLYVVGGDNGSAQSSVYSAQISVDGSVGAWNTEINSFNTPIQSHTISIWNQRIYVIGGKDSFGSLQKTVYTALINISGNLSSWTTDTNSLPAQIQLMGGVVWNEKMYISGGQSYSGVPQYSQRLYSSQFNADGSISGWVNETNILPVPLSGHSMCAWNKRLYICGGRSNSFTIESGVYSAPINPDGSIGVWVVETNSLPAPRTMHGMCVLNGRIYVIGGIGNFGTEATVFSSKINIDGTVGAWTTESQSMPGGQHDFAIGVWNEKIYIVGGYASGSPTSSKVYSVSLNVDGSIKSWTLEPNSLPAARGGASLIISDNNIYVSGGTFDSFNGAPAQTSLYYAPINIDGSIGVWNSGNMSVARTNHKMLCFNGLLYVIGGTTLNGQNNNQNSIISSGHRTYTSTGTYFSPFIDYGLNQFVTSMSINVTKPVGSLISVSISTAANNVQKLSNYFIPTSLNNINLPLRYLQYKIDMAPSSNMEISPSLNDITFNFDTTPPTNTNFSSIIPSTSSLSIDIGVVSDNESGLDPNPYYIDLSTFSTFSWINSSSLWQPGTNWIAKKLIPNTTYFIRAKARNSVLNESGWVSTSIVTLANPPIQTFISFVSSDNITVQWGTNNNAVGTNYKVEISTSDDFIQVKDSSAWQDTTSFAFNSLLPDSTYWFRAKSRNSQNIESLFAPLGYTATLAVSPFPPTIIADYDETHGIGYFCRVSPNFGQNKNSTGLSIKNLDSGNYLQGDGTTGPTPVWMKQSEWESGFLTNTEGALSPLTQYNYIVYAKNSSGIVNPVPSIVGSQITPPGQTSQPTIQEINDSSLQVSISYAPGADRYWISYTTWPLAPLSQYVYIATITPSATTYTDDFDGGSASTPTINLLFNTTSQLSINWNTPSVQPSQNRYYRVTAVDNFDRPGQRSLIGIGASQITPIVGGYGLYINGVFVTSTTGISYLANNLNPNSTYQIQIVPYTNENNLGGIGSSGIQQTLSEDPGQPFASLLASNSIRVLFSTGQNPGYTEYALFNIEGNGYVRIDGSLQAAPTFYNVQDFGGGSGRLHSGLLINTPYTYKVKGRNLAQVETLFSPVSNPIFTVSGPPSVTSTSHSTLSWSNVFSASFTATGANHYHYILDHNPISVPVSTNTLWSGTLLNLSLTKEGTWYFHVVGHNPAHVPSGITDFGPIWIDTTPPSGFGIQSLLPDTSRQITVTAALPNDLLSGSSMYFFDEVSGNPGGESSITWDTTPVFVNSGLNPNTQYSYRVRAMDVAGNISTNSSVTSIYTHASVPVPLGIPKISGSQLNVKWDNGGNPIGTRYEIDFSDDPNFSAVQVTSSTLLQSATVQNLLVNTTYFIRGRAVNQNGIYTEYNNLGVKLTPPGNISIIPDPIIYMTSATVNWLQGVDPAGTEYYVEASSDSNFVRSVQSSGWLLSFTTDFVNLSPNTSYYLRIKSRNVTLDESSFQLFKTAALLATAPSLGDKSVSQSPNSIQFSWNLNGNAQDTEFQADIASDNGFTLNLVQGLWVNSTNYTFTSLSPNSIYWARVKARNRFGVATDTILLSSRATLSPQPSVSSIISTGSWTALTIASFSASGSDHFHVAFTTNTSEILTGQNMFWNGSLLGFNMPFDGDWYLHVRGENLENASSGNVDVGPIRRDLSPPSLPVLVSPGQNSVVRINNPSFDWTSSTDANPIVYTLEVSTSIDYQPMLIQKSNLPSNSYIPLFAETLSDSVSYYWRVKARDSLINSTAYTPSTTFYCDLGDLVMLSRETYDSDDDGYGDSIKLVFNQSVQDITIDTGDFLIGTPSISPATSILQNVPGDLPNDKVIYLGSQNIFASDFEPTIRHIGSKIRSTTKKPMQAEFSGVTATDKIGPAVTRVQAATNNKINKSIVITSLSELISKAEALDLNRWIIESPIGSTIPVISANATYDPATLTVRFELPTSLTPGASLKITGKNFHDPHGNLRANTARVHSSIFKNFALNLSARNRGKLPFGIAVNSFSDVSVTFDRDLDGNSLKNSILVKLITDQNGLDVNADVKGSILLSSGSQVGRFIPSVPLRKGCLYQVLVASSLADTFGFLSDQDIIWQFRTAFDKSIQNTLYPQPNMKVVVNPGAFSEDAGLMVNLNPETEAILSDKFMIQQANERERKKGVTFGNGTHYPLPSMTFEIYGESVDGNPLHGQLGNTVTLSLAYDDADSDGIIDGTNPPVIAKNLQIYQLDENLGEYIPVKNSVVDTFQKTVTATVSHFSIFTAMSSLTGNINEARVGPNPWDPNEVPFVKIDNIPDSTEIDVYMVTGQKVASLRQNDGSGILQWDGRNDQGDILADGVYILNLKGNGNTKVLKLTIVR